MEKIASFTIDHIKLQPGVYVSRKDKVGENTITTFDLRMTSPNEEPVMNTAEMHTIEHLAATFLRNHAEYGSKTIYFGPMGCRTGFYLLLAGDYESKDIIPLMVEMYEFIRDFKEQMDVKNIIEKASMKFYEGILRGKDVVIVQCGIGKVNAGICVQILADLFQVDAVINTGVAGSLRAEINIGDIVVSTDACEHDMDVTALGYKQGIIPQMKESFFKADRQLVEAAIEVCREVNPDINVYEGRVLSGDQFISGEEIKNKLIDLFDGSCTEMEGAAIAHAAFLNEIPYVVIRAISDKADGSAHMDYPEFERAAAAHSAKLVENLVKRL